MDNQLSITGTPLSTTCAVMGAASIVASIGIWASKKGDTDAERAHAERFGIFVGLWAPTFFILADMLGRSATRSSARV